MATESIFHNIVLREPAEIERFVEAIEKSRQMAKKHATTPRPKPVKTATPAEVKRLFADKKTWVGLSK